MSNNKGFTMVELLAVFVLLGILSMITIPAVTKYLDKAKNEDFDALSVSAYNGAKEAFLNNDDAITCATTTTCSITLSELLEHDYISSLQNPYDKESDCDGTVEITKEEGSSTKTKTDEKGKTITYETLEDYIYTVHLQCGTDHKTDIKYDDKSTMTD